MVENDLRKAHNDPETVTKIMQAKDGEIDKYRKYCQTTNAETKSLKERLKGNITLIEAKDIIWNEIIGEMKAAWEYLTIVS